jgi:hypothetical protein
MQCCQNYRNDWEIIMIAYTILLDYVLRRIFVLARGVLVLGWVVTASGSVI